jgi:hypothetical protein
LLLSFLLIPKSARVGGGVTPSDSAFPLSLATFARSVCARSSPKRRSGWCRLSTSAFRMPVMARTGHCFLRR